MTYQIHTALKEGIIHFEVENLISLFRRLYIEQFKYQVFRTISFKLFVENKGKFVPIFSHVFQDKLLGSFSYTNKFYQQPFFEEYSFEKNDIFNNLFEELLVNIENQYAKFVSEGRTISSSFKKALSYVLQTKRNFSVLHVAYKFFVSSFSFVHGKFRERNFHLFHGEKKSFIKFGTNKTRIYSNNISIYNSQKIVVRNNNEIVEEILLSKKEYSFFLNLVSLYDSYANKLNSNPFISNIIYNLGISKQSKQRFFLNYFFEKNFIDKDIIKPFKFKKQEYATDMAYIFMNSKCFNSNFHPVSMVSHHDYIDYSVEHLELFMKAALSLPDSKYLFHFIELFGPDYTFSLLNFEENFEHLSEEYLQIISYIKKQDKKSISFNKFNGVTYSFFGVPFNDEKLLIEELFNSHWNSIFSLSSFRYLNYSYQKHLIDFFVQNGFNPALHIFYLSLLNMAGFNIHSLTFNECFDSLVFGSLKNDNLVLEQNLLNFISNNLFSLKLIFNRKQFLCILFLLKKIYQLSPADRTLDLFYFIKHLKEVSDLPSLSKKFHHHFSSFNRINLNDLDEFFRPYKIFLIFRDKSDNF